MELKRKTEDIYWQENRLLIVPYGIETPETLGSQELQVAFNRTLWN